jgi:hypothetical protein
MAKEAIVAESIETILSSIKTGTSFTIAPNLRQLDLSGNFHPVILS